MKSKTYRLRRIYVTTKDGRSETRNVLADGAAGELRGPVTREEAIAIAQGGLFWKRDRFIAFATTAGESGKA